MQSLSKDPVCLGELEQLLLLAILQCGDGAYTVPIRELLARRSGRKLTRGALFTSLDRLEAKGLLRSWMGEPLAIRGGRSRRYFEVTRSGLVALRAARAAVQTMSEGLDLDGLVGRKA
jgi:DNA-binding PadR family transcriptional regulator